MAHHCIGELRLLALTPAQRQRRTLMPFDPPGQLAASVLMNFGITLETLLIVNTRARVVPGSDSRWSLKSGNVGAVLVWLPPRLRADRMRRLQLTAQQPLRLALCRSGFDHL